MRFGLPDYRLVAIINVISKYDVINKALIFGSRARGDYQYNSDIDIAIYMNKEMIPGLFDEN